MKKRKQKSLKKIRMLFLLLILTAVIMITATYAWFSTQKEVEVTGMRLNVEVAESMQISLDGEKWVQSIEIKDMRQFYGSYSDTSTHQANPITEDDGNTNYVPKELLPVSTAGEVASGKLQFVQGVVTNGETTKLTGITACSEDDLTKTAEISTRQEGDKNHPYMVFDMYLRNISAKTTGQDDLKLNAGSKVYVNTATTDDTEQEGKGVADTGLEYSARVGMIVYGNTVSVTATDTADATVAEQIRGLTAKDTDVAAIWEPNNLNHTTYVVSNNGRGITSTSQAVTTYGIKSAVATAATKEIADVNSTTDTNLVAVNTFKPAYTLANGTNEATVITNTAGANVGLAPNQISKVRVYIWLEGQDPDCIDLASTGDKLSIDLKLTKDGTNLTDKNTYTGTGEGSGNVKIPVGTKLTAATLNAMTEDEKKEIYGQTVTNYADTSSDAQKSVNWKIFHSDGTNIYLIADDYIDRSYVPTGKSGTAVSPSLTYARAFPLAPAADYSGWTDISSTNIATKWLSQYVASGYTSENENIKATAYLLDTNQWGVFKNSSYAEYAIGGPTIELFTASYNATHETDIETQVSSATGYKVKWSTDESFKSYISGLSTDESLYVISDETNALGMWVASPSASYSSSVMFVDYSGYVSNAVSSNTGDGSRACVFLKSSIQIEKQEDGTYKIID